METKSNFDRPKGMVISVFGLNSENEPENRNELIYQSGLFWSRSWLER